MKRRFTESHEWITIEGTVGTVGVTDHAQQELGDIVYVELPIVGSEVRSNQEAVVLESTKAAADVYSPATGIIIAINERLNDAAELVNSDAEGEGWLFKIELTDPNEVDCLLTRETYESQFK